jgi:hypothetical protein
MAIAIDNMSGNKRAGAVVKSLCGLLLAGSALVGLSELTNAREPAPRPQQTIRGVAHSVPALVDPPKTVYLTASEAQADEVRWQLRDAAGVDVVAEDSQHGRAVLESMQASWAGLVNLNIVDLRP